MSLLVPNSKSKLLAHLQSSIVSKLIIAVCGLLLLAFVIVHLLGNLLIFTGTRDKINNYAHSLEQLGIAIDLIELFFVIVVIAHVAYAIFTAAKNSAARSKQYHYIKSAGKPSHQSIFSITMKYTGAILLLFAVFHVATFKFGVFTTIPYLTSEDGTKSKDIYELILVTFHQPSYTLIYLASIVALSFHLQHGCSSAIQSLGMSNPKYMSIFSILSTLLSLLIAIGFSSIPLCIYFGIIS
jgi:succinate dehydrogenase / fumarate reductase, cytochrome b subunit